MFEKYTARSSVADKNATELLYCCWSQSRGDVRVYGRVVLPRGGVRRPGAHGRRPARGRRALPVTARPAREY